MSEKFTIAIAPDQKVTAIAYPAAKRDRAGITLILGHGAGAPERNKGAGVSGRRA